MDINFLEAMAKVAIFFPPFLFALCFHEFAHGWTAQKFGDDTAKYMGRLTMNPIVHMDVLGTLILPIAGVLMGGFVFGWAKPVPVNPRNLSNEKTQMFWIALAGPLSNLLLGLIGAIFYVIVASGVITFKSEMPLEFMRYFVLINAMLAVFNLIPVHPLDGGKVLARFLPENINRTLEANQAQSGIFLMAFLFLGGFRLLWIPIQGLAQLMTGFGALVVSPFL